jgi:hypothetical protein
MSNRHANDYNDAEGSLAHNAGWRDLWAGLLLTLFLLGSAILVAVFFSGPTSSLSKQGESAAAHVSALLGVRDPSRPGWRTAVMPWDLVGIDEMTPDIEDRGRGEGTEDRGRREATIETSIANVWQARTP